ncbi:MAG: DEAD/DEAH box helicase family protein, partial [Opitutaceae bacterium]|nr:DEAD/DEAH box helicase family protein [Opitutaceae bacterium]
MPATPEQQARQQIDAMLEASGWIVQDYKKLNPSVAQGIAIREVSLKTGPCDYLLLVDRKPVGIIEAKRVGFTLSIVAEQSSNYARNLPDFLAALCPADIARLPFAYESTGVETLFRDERDPHPRSRRVFSFHRPETLAAWLDDATDNPAHPTLRARLAAMPAEHPLITDGMRACQIEAITNLETSLAGNRPRALLKMATGSGKTYTACAFSHRLIKHAGARRILFLVDRANLGKQAKGEFDQFRTPDANRKFTELYNVQHLTSNKLDPVARVTICTIQRLYSMLRGETDLAEDLDDLSTADLSAAYQSRSGVPPLNPSDKRQDAASTLDVAYNPAIPIETFDFAVIDECHRSIYNLWRQVLEYFDAHLIGLSATPSAQTVAFFNQNLVMDYGHERAVADNVNVGYDVYRIRTHITEHGATIEKGFHVTKRDRQTRALRQQLLDTDLAYAPAQLDRTVVNPSQIRTILQALRDALVTDLFPGRALVPKTLIFAKDDSHAEEIVHLTREVFGRGNDFCKKITYQSKHHLTGKPAKKDDLIAEFRNSPTLRIAVTVDMIATGTDIKALECLVFLRDVHSLGYFEQMKGRGTRVLTPTELQSVSGADARAKTHFVIVDAVGVCESDKTESQPLDKQPTVALDKLLLAVPLGKRDDDTLSTLASRLTRLERQLTPAEIAAKILPHTGGKTLGQIARALLESLDPDKVEAASRRLLSEQEAAWLAERASYFNPYAPLNITQANLPHWSQDQATCFVTFRLTDSLPSEKLRQWMESRDHWLATHKEPHTEQETQEYHQLFSATIEDWLDQGAGSCVLALPECHEIVANALRHFDAQRYTLGDYVIAANHVHLLVTPKPGHELSEILHSWKSFTAKEIIKVEAASRRLTPWWDTLHARRQEAATATQNPAHYPAPNYQRPVWQKESFDHIVRSPASLCKFVAYIRNHSEWQQKIQSGSGILPLCPGELSEEDKRRDAASTFLTAAKKELTAAACAPFDNPDFREALLRAKRENEQTIDTANPDHVIARGLD